MKLNKIYTKLAIYLFCVVSLSCILHEFSLHYSSLSLISIFIVFSAIHFNKKRSLYFICIFAPLFLYIVYQYHILYTNGVHIPPHPLLDAMLSASLPFVFYIIDFIFINRIMNELKKNKSE